MSRRKSAKTKEIGSLKPFWPECSKVWIAHADAFFANHGIDDDADKWDFVEHALEGNFKTNYEEAYQAIFNENDPRRPFRLWPKKHRYSFTEAFLRGARLEEFEPDDQRKIPKIDIKYLTKGAVKSVLGGEWNGQPFYVQIIAMPPTHAMTDQMFVQITDGRSAGVVRISTKMTPTMKEHLGKRSTFPVLRVTGVEFDFLEGSMMHKQRPGAV